MFADEVVPTEMHGHGRLLQGCTRLEPESCYHARSSDLEPKDNATSVLEEVSVNQLPTVPASSALHDTESEAALFGGVFCSGTKFTAPHLWGDAGGCSLCAARTMWTRRQKMIRTVRPRDNGDTQ